MKVIASFDDGAIWDMKLADLMAKHSIPTIFYWTSNIANLENMTKVREFLSEKQRQKIAQHFNVGSHTKTHRFLTKIPLSEVENELVESKKHLESRFEREITSFCYPRGYANDEIRSLVKKSGYLDARNTLIGLCKSAENPYWTGTSVHIGIDRPEYAGDSWEQYFRIMHQKASSELDGVFHMFGHSWEIERENDWANLDELLKDLK